MNRFSIVLLFFTILTCNIIPDNLTDPHSPNYVKPYLIFDTTGVHDGDTITTGTAIVSFTGNLSDKNEYRYRIDSLEWTSWQETGAASEIRIPFTDADTGKHTLAIQTCYHPNGDITDTTIKFVYTTVTPANTNHKPVFRPYAASAADTAGKAIVLTFTAADSDMNALTFSMLDTAAFTPGEIVHFSTDSSMTVTLLPTDTSKHVITVQVSDGSATTTAVVTVTVVPAIVPVAPVFTAYDSLANVKVGVSITLRLRATDANGDSLIYTLPDSASFTGKINHSLHGDTLVIVFTPSAVGPFLIRVEASDGQLTATARISVNVKINDTTPPSLRLRDKSLDSTRINMSSVLIEVEAADDDKVDSVSATLDSAVKKLVNIHDSLWSAEVGGLSNGEYSTITILAWDRSGNSVSLPLTVKYDPTMQDSLNPRITLASPASVVADSVVTIVAKVTDGSGVALVKINDSTVTSSDSLFRHTVKLVKGDNKNSVYAKDKSANANDSTVVFIITYDPTCSDTTGPKIRLRSPANNTTLTATPATVTVEVTDASGITASSVKINTIVAAATDAIYSAAVPLIEGHNSIQVTAEDASFNHTSSSANYNLKLDLPPTAVTVNTPTNVTTTGMNISWSASNASDFTCYNVFYATTPNVNEQSTMAPSITIKMNRSFAFTGLTPNTPLYCKVYVCDSTSCVASNEITATTAATPVTLSAIQGVTAPAIGATPVTMITATAQYTGTVAWSPAVATTFLRSQAYTATITLTPTARFTFAGVAANSFTVAGAMATNPINTGTVTAVFPATAAAPVTLKAILGVTAPKTGATPVMTITATAQYTGTVAWSPAVATTFLGSQAYIATITLTPTAGFTFAGVAANSFTVAGATATNPMNTDTVTAVFPATAAAPVTLLVIPGVVTPVRGEAPVTTAINTAQYTGTITWAPDNNPFAEATVYTANIVLTAKAGWTLNGVAANSFTVAGATATNPIDTGTVTAVFPATAAAPKNLIANGGFDDGMTGWNFCAIHGATGKSSIVEGQLVCEIINPGGAYDIQLFQKDLTIEKGVTYVIFYDIKSNVARTLQSAVELQVGPYTQYACGAPVDFDCNPQHNVTTTMQTFTREFTMAAETITQIRLNFNFGGVASTVTFDNISIVDKASIH
jgi:hypothetical protein